MPTAIDNDIYRRLGHAWWDDDLGMFASIRYGVNPVRFGYFSRLLDQDRAGHRDGLTLLDVGCGGGFLSEDYARAGYQVAGIDPAPESIAAARAHAAESGLAITYQVAAGEALPFPAASFDVVVCCDVLEHVDDPDRVLAEIGRVLRPGGRFFYDTINRTPLSRLFVIKVMQEWRATAFATPRAHVWEKFLRPQELVTMLGRHGLAHRAFRGLAPRANPLSCLVNFHRRARGRISFRELGRRLRFGESARLHVSYMGWAVRTAPAP